MNFIKNLLLYGGLDREKYLLIHDKIRESNRRSLMLYSAITGFGMLIMLILSFFVDVLVSSRISYIFAFGLSAITFLIAMFLAKKNLVWVPICIYSFTSILLAFGILLGTAVEPNQASVSYGILLFAVPLLFTDIPIATDMLMLISIAVYIIAAKFTQTAEMFAFNLSVIFPYGIVGLILCAIVMRTKVSREMLDYDNKILSERDQLTGMLNRRCYEQELNVLREKQDDIKVLLCAFDVNSLKKTNDTLGHKAGDELICAAAKAIESVFGRYGTCYRIGGDEFFAIIEGESPDSEALEAEFERCCLSYHGTLVQGLAISCGIVKCASPDKITESVNDADRMMYKRKEIYYNNK